MATSFLTKRKFSKLIAVAAFVSASFGAVSVQAGEFKIKNIAVLELFTSQGCSSCPPADALLAEVGKRDDVIALAYHVDYWDYIGWEDTFGSESNANFQRAYARSLGEKVIYTPQLVVNGSSHVVGSRRGDVAKAIKNAQLPIQMQAREVGNVLEIDIPQMNGDIKEANIWIVPFINESEVKIQRGENRGKAITYSHIVRDKQPMGMWKAGDPVTMHVPLDSYLSADVDGLAILLQSGSKRNPGAILGAISYMR